jgi:hypothetical protein
VIKRREELTVTAVLGGLFLWKLYQLFGMSDDRPPIRVRGGSLYFETDTGWEEQGGEWRSRQKNAKKVRNFKVTVDGSSTCSFTSPQLTITYKNAAGVSRVFKVVRAGGEPRILPGSHLKQHKHFDRIVHDETPGGKVVEIKGAGSNKECALPDDAVVIIDFEYEKG